MLRKAVEIWYKRKAKGLHDENIEEAKAKWHRFMHSIDNCTFEREMKAITKREEAKLYNRKKEIDDVLTGKKSITDIPKTRKLHNTKEA